jgi:hypothetical protein
MIGGTAVFEGGKKRWMKVMGSGISIVSVVGELGWN